MGVAEAIRGIEGTRPLPHEPTREELLERARGIALRARERAGETEAARNVPAATIAELREADLMRLVVPREWGGLGRGFMDLCEVVYALSQGCASTGWIYSVLAGHAIALRDFGREVQAEIWGDGPDATASSAYAPTGRLVPADAGFRLSGRFPFSSGSDHAQWSIVGALLFDGKGPPSPRLALVPRGELGTLDDWHTLGLAGTGSRSLVADDLFVPARRVLPMPPFKGFEQFSLQSALAGMARSAVDGFVDDYKEKPGRMGCPPPRESDLVQTKVGQSWGDAVAAWTLIREAIRRTEEATADDGSQPPRIAAINRALTATVTQLAVTAIERVYELSGGSGIYDNHLSRALRDARSASQHLGLNANVTGKMAGEFRFGITSGIPGF